MLRSLLLNLFAISIAVATGFAADNSQKPQSVAQPKRGTPTKPELTYDVVLLDRGEHAETIPADSTEAIQSSHRAYIMNLADEKKVALFGPFTDDTALRSLFVLRGVSVEEAKELCDAD